MRSQKEENETFGRGKLLSIDSKSYTSSADYSQESSENEEQSIKENCEYQHKNTTQESHSFISAKVIPKTDFSINVIPCSDDSKASEVCSNSQHIVALNDVQIDAEYLDRKIQIEELESSKGCHKWMCNQEINKSGESFVQNSCSNSFELNEKESDLASIHRLGLIDLNKYAINQSEHHKIFKVEHMKSKMKRRNKRESKLKRKFKITQFDCQFIRNSTISLSDKCPASLQANTHLHSSEIQYDQAQIGFMTEQLNHDEALHCDHFLECIDDASEYQDDISNNKMFVADKPIQLSSYMNDSIHQRPYYQYPMCFNVYEDQSNPFSNDQISNLSSPPPAIHSNFDIKCKPFREDLFERNQN